MKKTTLILTAAALAGSLTFASADGDRTIGNGDLPDFLVEYDVNGDGTIDEEERQAMKDARREARAERHAQWDTDGDGEISDEEREAARAALRARIEEKRNERFHAADTDGDGCLSLEEFSAIPAVARLAEKHPDKVLAIYNRLDANGEDGVKVDEFTAHLGHRRSGNRPPPRNGGGGGGGGGDDPDGPPAG